MRKRLDSSEVKRKYGIFGFIGERFSIYLSKKWSKPRIGIWRAEDGQTLLLALLWVKIIYIPLSVYEGMEE